jgi:hypothetical protein
MHQAPSCRRAHLLLLLCELADALPCRNHLLRLGSQGGTLPAVVRLQLRHALAGGLTYSAAQQGVYVHSN